MAKSKEPQNWREKFDGAVINMGTMKFEPVDTISTGSINVDIATGMGGFPRGRISEIYGLQSAGKTSLCIHAIAEAHKRGLKALVVDAEQTFDYAWAVKLGADPNLIELVQPDDGEQGMEIIRQAVKSNEYGIILCDSVTALIPRAELEGDIGDAHVGRHARLMSQGLKIINSEIGKTGTALVFVNQIRKKIGVMFGSPNTTTGGEALKFWASLRLEITAIGKLKEGEKVIGNRVLVKVVKNKLRQPYVEAEFDFLFSSGVNCTAEILDAALDKNVVEKSGTTISFKGEKLGVGRAKALDFLKVNPTVLEDLRKELRG